MQKNISNTRVLLYSGGMDSWLIDKIWKPDLKLFVDMGTASSREERKRLPKDVKIVEFQSLGQFERPQDFILPLRNLYLFMIASNYGEEICLGATSTDVVLDKTQEFAKKATDLLGYMYQPQKWTPERHPRLNVDFKKYSKSQLLSIYLNMGGRGKRLTTRHFPVSRQRTAKSVEGAGLVFSNLWRLLTMALICPVRLWSHTCHIFEKK